MIFTNPLYGFFRTLFLFATGRVNFRKSEIGATIVMADGEEFRIFRRVVIKKYVEDGIGPKGLFIVRFKPKMDLKANIQLSRIMLLIFMGFQGFRSKYWCVNERTGVCQGIYEWDTLADARRYSKSIAVKNMTKRSEPDSVSFQVLENTFDNRDWRIDAGNQNDMDRFRVKYNLA